jgi:hypothetical protein
LITILIFGEELKIKIKLSLCLAKYQAMKTSAIDGDELSASRPGRLIPG